MPGLKVFLSYSSKDKEQVRVIAAYLRGRGHLVWEFMDGQTVGLKIYDTIQDAIDQTDWVVFVISSSSIVSKWIDTESEIAATKHKDRCGVVLGQCDYENSAIWRRIVGRGNFLIQDPTSQVELREFCDVLCSNIEGRSGFRGEPPCEMKPGQLQAEAPQPRNHVVHSAGRVICVSLVRGVAGYGARKANVAKKFGNPVGGRWKLTPQQFEQFRRIVEGNLVPRE